MSRSSKILSDLEASLPENLTQKNTASAALQIASVAYKSRPIKIGMFGWEQTNQITWNEEEEENKEKYITFFCDNECIGLIGIAYIIA